MAVRPHEQRRLLQLVRKLLAGLAVGLATGTVVGLGLGVGLAAGLTGGLVAGCLMGIMEWLNTPADAIRSPTPASVLRNDRTVSVLRMFLGAIGLGLVVGFFAGPGLKLPIAITVSLVGGVVIGITHRLFGVRGVGPEASAWAWSMASRSWLALHGKLP